jgi:hypothetical protein
VFLDPTFLALEDPVEHSLMLRGLEVRVLQICKMKS